MLFEVLRDRDHPVLLGHFFFFFFFFLTHLPFLRF